LGDFEYPNRDALLRLEYEPAKFWSLYELEAILVYHYIKWRNNMIARAEVLRYGERILLDPLTNEEAAYIVLAIIPYEEPCLYIHENFFGEFKYQNKDLPIGLELEKAEFWSLSAIETIMIDHYMKWRDAMIKRGVLRHEVLRYGEQELPTPPIEVELPRLEELLRNEVNPTPPNPWKERLRKRKKDEKNTDEASSPKGENLKKESEK